MKEDISSVVFDAITFHRDVMQRRKYTGENYEIHPAQVAALAAAIWKDYEDQVPLHVFIAVAWWHDVMEDTKGRLDDIFTSFSHWSQEDQFLVIQGINLLTDINEPGMNRETRLNLQALRICQGPIWVQALKLVDNHTNITSIAVQDPKFLKVYLQEKRVFLAKINPDSHPTFYNIVSQTVQDAQNLLDNIQSCPQCKTGQLVYRNKNIPYNKDGLIKYFKDVTGHHCTDCGYVHLKTHELGEQKRSIIHAAKTNKNIVIQ